MNTWTCKLCDAADRPQPYESEDQLLDHVTVVHNLEKVPYIRYLGVAELQPDKQEGEQEDFKEPSDIEMAMLRQWRDQGFDVNDERLKRACFLTAFLRGKESEARTQGIENAQVANMVELRPLYKEVRDTLAELKREKRQETAGKKDEDLLMAALKDAEKYVAENPDDFQFRCQTCGSWNQTDGMPVWMLQQDVDPDNPERRRVHVGNPEITFLVKSGYLPLSMAAFILRTSPEGLLWTADQRSEVLFDPDVVTDVLARAEGEVTATRKLFDEYRGV